MMKLITNLQRAFLVLVLLPLPMSLAQDTDFDGLDDDEETRLGTLIDNVDTDGDHLSDRIEVELGSDPLNPDTDFDGLDDYAEIRVWGTNPGTPDSDRGYTGDGTEIYIDFTNPNDPADDREDSDGDGLRDVLEDLLGCDRMSADSDKDGLSDGVEDRNRDGHWDAQGGSETDPTDPDTDGDGLVDGLERYYGADPFTQDSDSDQLGDGLEILHRTDGSPDTGCLHPAEADSDFDGLDDGLEIDLGSSPCLADSDNDGIYDAVEFSDQTDPSDPDSFLPDQDGDGLSDRYESMVSASAISDVDTDGDGLSDAQELLPLTDRCLSDPLDADSDDDGILDGNEGGILVSGKPEEGTSVVDADSDDDGLPDGLEIGLAAPEISGKDPDATRMDVFRADLDPTSTTDPLKSDTDGDKLPDGVEDADQNGVLNPSETHPNLFDSDNDGIGDGWESAYSAPSACDPSLVRTMNPLDPTDGPSDLDDDGLTSLEEYQLYTIEKGREVPARTNPCMADTDKDGLTDGVEVLSQYSTGSTSPLHPDSDSDGLPDGVEDKNTNGIWDVDTETDPLTRDTDGDGLLDGWEDSDHDGAKDLTETDPLTSDTDGDGLADGREVRSLGTNPLDPDSDADGLADSLEIGVLADSHPASQTEPLEADSDNDGLLDGLEDTNKNGRWDPGETNPLCSDTDGDTLADGEEDANLNGAFEPDLAETSPVLADTDQGGVNDGIEHNRHETDPLDPADDGLGWLSDDAKISSGCGACVSYGAGVSSPPGWLLILLGAFLLRRRKTKGVKIPTVVTVLLVFGLVLEAPRAAEHPDARNTSIDANPYRLQLSGLGVLSCESGRVLDHLNIRTSLVTHHLARPLTVRHTSDGTLLRSLVDNRQQLDLGAVVGLFDLLEVGLQLPVVVHQAGEYPGQKIGSVASSGLGNLQLHLKGQILSEKDMPVSLAFGLPVTLPTGNDGAYMGTKGVGLEPRVSASRPFGSFQAALSLGYLLQPRSSLFNVIDDDKITMRLGLALEMPGEFWDVGIEFTGAVRAAAPFQNSDETYGEIVLGGRMRVGAGIAIIAGAGSGLLPGVPATTFRAFVGLAHRHAFSRKATPPPPPPAPLPPAVVEPAPEPESDDPAPKTEIPKEAPEEKDEPPVAKAASYKFVILTESRILTTRPIRFVSSGTTLLAQSQLILDEVLKILEEHPGMHLRIEGHTDSVGTDSYNLRLSDKRARAVRDYLVQKANPESKMRDRLETVGLGERQPIAPNITRRGQMQNRRIEFHIVTK